MVNSCVIAAAELPAWTLLVLASFEAVAGLPMALQQLGQVLPAARRLFSVADRRPPIAEPSAPCPWPKTVPALQVQHLWFRYVEGAAWALRNVSFDLPPGGRVALVGASGCGKTTLVNLLVRFWDYREGRILLGGHELREYAAEETRRHMAVVSQHARLFTGTIRDNLRLAAPDADAAALEAACRTAQIHDFIAAQPQGYDTFVGEAGLQLSGGQIRRLAIAQALLKDAPYLLLDEPTEGLDPATEHDLMAALLRLTTGRSVLLITHRLAGLDAMDEVLLLDRGAVVERGTHRELMQRSRRYREFHDGSCAI
jgi:ATP-binding cassette subfamily C protein CydC